MKRTCIVCGALTTRSRCTVHEREQRSIYGRPWRTVSRPVLDEHVARHGWRCLGDAFHGAHDTRDLTVDHVIPGSLDGGLRVVCRSANTAKRNRGW